MVVQLVKSLKPKRLKPKEVRLKILNELRAEGRFIVKEFNKTTATWQGEKPKFEALIGLTGKDTTVIIGPTGNNKGILKWIWLDQGTKKNYPITAKNKPFLTFRDGRGFTPKTKVKVFSSGPGANAGTFVKKKKVIHPGIKAREWSKEIVKRRRKPFTNKIIKAARI